jgi:hypothetical protein
VPIPMEHIPVKVYLNLLNKFKNIPYEEGHEAKYLNEPAPIPFQLSDHCLVLYDPQAVATSLHPIFPKNIHWTTGVKNEELVRIWHGYRPCTISLCSETSFKEMTGKNYILVNAQAINRSYFTKLELANFVIYMQVFFWRLSSNTCLPDVQIDFTENKKIVLKQFQIALQSNTQS